MSQRNFSGYSSSSRPSRDYDSHALPRAWLDCPERSKVIAGRFIVFKTPLDDNYRERIPRDKRWTCKRVIDTVQEEKRELGLVIDLTNTSRFYNAQEEFQKKEIEYHKIRCVSRDEIPTSEQYEEFLRLCLDFIAKKPDDVIGVHCIHGFNRSGYMICAYLCRHLKYSWKEAVEVFAEARPPGIYEQDFLDKLRERYGARDSDSMPAPHRPSWESRNDRSRSTSAHDDRPQNSSARFVIDHPKITVVGSDRAQEIRRRCQQLCRWDRKEFLGSQPVPMHQGNYQRIFLQPYRVSWKADGTRYLMLIQSENNIFMLDRNNHVFHIADLQFPYGKPAVSHLTDTLLDGEFVLDNDRGTIIPRYLVFDIITYHSDYVGDRPFPERLSLCQTVIEARNARIGLGYIDKSKEPFSVRDKRFDPVTRAPNLLSERFRNQITHGMDGLIFQPENEPYQSGIAPNVFKWKYEETIDFRLKLERHDSRCKALLYVHGLDQPYATMSYSPDLDRYDGCIIECAYRENQWRFYRQCADKAYPNTKAIADSVMVALENRITPSMLCLFVEEHLGFENYRSE